MTSRVGSDPSANVLVIVDAHEGMAGSVAMLSGVEAGTMTRVTIEADARTGMLAIEAIARGQRVPVSVEPSKIVVGTIPRDPAGPPLY
jgi:hypothetical protein